MDVPEILPGEDRSLGSDLFVDLVPATCWFTHVRSCVSPADWRRLRQMITERAGQRCEACGAGPDPAQHRRLEAHERWMFDDDAGVQRLKRLICLCSDCHAVTHYGLAQIRGHGEQALEHLMRVTGMTRQEALAHVRRAFEIWEERSERVWDLDLSILTDAGVTLAPPPAAAARPGIAAQTLHDKRASRG
ncbi:DNA primase [Streptomyces sp. NBC_01601]|uniref:DNA primase n=1 Tax=Streptomyces sp. NBC_01601 TaxID=2975892 RepID=UPI002E2B7585|nr:DNA primase [Streptomyces sp. NBC_01601]